MPKTTINWLEFAGMKSGLSLSNSQLSNIQKLDQTHLIFLFFILCPLVLKICLKYICFILSGATDFCVSI